MQIDLKKFCRKSHYIRTLIEPFSDNDYTYASCGSIIIRVDKIREVIEIGKSVQAKELFEENKINGNEIWTDLPKFEVIEKNCNECDGTGKIIVCKECGGEGTLEFDSDYNTYEVQCKSCFNRKIKDRVGRNVEDEKCEDCEGTGKYKKYSNPIVEIPIIIDGSLESIEIMINGMYLEMIQDLPNIKIALQGKTEPIKLKFDGGIGLLMPIESLRPIS